MCIYHHLSAPYASVLSSGAWDWSGIACAAGEMDGLRGAAGPAWQTGAARGTGGTEGPKPGNESPGQTGAALVLLSCQGH